MDLVRLVYHSRRRIEAGRCTSQQTMDIMIDSVANNRRDDVTGGMIHDLRRFAQVLEGPQAAVTDAFERILRDPRHGDVALVSMMPIQGRRFGDWWMAEGALTAETRPLFRRHGEGDDFDPTFMPADRLIDLIDAVVRNAVAAERGASTAA